MKLSKLRRSLRHVRPVDAAIVLPVLAFVVWFIATQWL